MDIFRLSTGRPAILLVVLALAAGCARDRSTIPPGTEPDRFLFERGTENLENRRWLSAREFFRQIVDGYPQSPYRAEAKLGIGDSFVGEGRLETYVQAVNEYREFLTFYPTHERADYAQYKLAMTHFEQMARPERDQTHTRDAIAEFDVFLERYPNSALAEEVRTRRREARDRLSESHYHVGLFYYRTRWYPGAIDRFQTILKDDPEFTNRDAVYYHLAESLLRLEQPAAALPYYEKLVEEFAVSQYLADSQKRVAELKAPPQP